MPLSKDQTIKEISTQIFNHILKNDHATLHELVRTMMKNKDSMTLNSADKKLLDALLDNTRNYLSLDAELLNKTELYRIKKSNLATLNRSICIEQAKLAKLITTKANLEKENHDLLLKKPIETKRK